MSISALTCAAVTDGIHNSGSQEPLVALLCPFKSLLWVRDDSELVCFSWQVKSGTNVNMRTKQKAFRVRCDWILQLSGKAEIFSVVGTLGKVTAEE